MKNFKWLVACGAIVLGGMAGGLVARSESNHHVELSGDACRSGGQTIVSYEAHSWDMGSAGGLNDAVKGFVVEHLQRIFLDLTNLKVYVPEPDYLLAMKTLAARVEGTDKEDVKFLIALLGITQAEDVFAILEKYYPRRQIKPATQFFVEELFET